MNVSAAWQSRSASWPRPVWYQTTETRPAEPAAIHGQYPIALSGYETAIGDDHVLPKSFE